MTTRASGGRCSSNASAAVQSATLPPRQHRPDGAAPAIRERVDLGRPAAARPTDPLRDLPPFPPLAERGAETAELSMSTCAGGPPASARASKMRTRRTHGPTPSRPTSPIRG